MKTMNTMTPHAPGQHGEQREARDRALCACENSWKTAVGSRATMPAKMISETPLPTPRLVICSPSHIRNMVPPVSVTIVDRMKNGPGLSTAPWLDCKAMAMPADWKMASTTVR